eukprot:Gb_14788 [translate_table: standard]
MGDFDSVNSGFALFNHGAERRLVKPGSANFYGRKFLEINSESIHANFSNVNQITEPEVNTFDPNIIVVLAALLCAVMAALGFNYIIRCALSCTRRIVVQSSDDVAAPVAVLNTGLNKMAIKALPTIIYAKHSQLPPQVASTDCPICLTEFAEGENIRVLPKCNHRFHIQCIDTWLLSHSSCPTCRHCLRDALEKKTMAALLSHYQRSQATENGTIHIVFHPSTDSQTSQTVATDQAMQRYESFQQVPEDTAVNTLSSPEKHGDDVEAGKLEQNSIVNPQFH